MVALSAILGFLLYFNVISGYILIDDGENELVWPSEYHFTGEKINFETTLKEPFEIWYSADYNRSRIDYYGGSSQMYFNGIDEVMYSIFPMASADLEVELFCREESTGDGQADFLPDVTGLTFTGETILLFDKMVDVWYSKETEEGLEKEQTLYVAKTDHGVDIPVQHIEKTFDLERGLVDTHLVTNYYNFDDSVSEEDVTPDESADCGYSGAVGSDFKTDVETLHPDIPQHVDILFESYANHHNKAYHEKEVHKRKRIFHKNWKMVHHHNRNNKGFRMTLNEFSDRTPEELKYLTGTSFNKEPSTYALPFPHTLEEIDEIVEELPENYDLRMEGAVTPIKNQGSCGSCWAFATTATLEGALAKSNGQRLVDLSEQSVVDCAWGYDNYGCDGGMLDTAWRYIYENGIPTEREYGVYTAHDDYCRIQNMSTVFKIKGFTSVTPRNPNALKAALYKYGPISIGVQAGDQMVHYANGIFYDFTCTRGPNHAVTVVGYGVRDGEDYWIVKNSWGEAWGEDGYILMSARNGNCFLLDYPYAVVV